MKLKPVVFIKGKYGYHSQDTTKQIMLLKALRITKDPRKIKEIMGLRTMAEVYRVFDKITARKEYQSALARHGVTFDYIVSNLKKEIDTAEKSSERLMAINILLKSVGLDKYEDTDTGSGSWEEELLKITGEKTDERKTQNREYEVILPEIPEDVRIAKEKEKQDGRSLYE